MNAMNADRLLTEWRDAALAVGALRYSTGGLVDEWATKDARQLGKRIAAVIPDTPRQAQPRVPVRGYAAEAVARVGRFIRATDAAVLTGRYPGRELQVDDCIRTARGLRASLEIVALHTAPVVEVDALGLREMVAGSGATSARLSDDLIRALEEAQDAGVVPASIDSLRGRRSLTPAIVRLATLVHQGIPLEYATAIESDA